MSGYIGNAPVPQATQTRQTFTATSGQTSFATIGYVAGGQFIQVYLNGVLLKLTDDYTAANGSDIVLTSGAATGDILEFITFADFTVNNQNFTGTTTAADLSVTGAFTSQGIDDNATSTAMTLDASGNLLVGQSSTSIPGIGNTTNGVSIRSGGNNSIAVSRDGDVAGYFNRNTSDGEIIQFRKDGSAVGSIGNLVTTTYIETSGQTGLGFYSNHISPRYNGSGADATADLGRSSQRFKDLYLSGGVYLGGTGSANKISDYETGLWAPVIRGATDPTVTVITAHTGGRYIKVGNMVWVSFECRWSAITGGSGNCYISGLPFTRKTTLQPDGDRSTFDFYQVTVPSGGINPIVSVGTGTTTLGLSFGRSANTTASLPVANLLNANPGFIRASVVYETS